MDDHPPGDYQTTSYFPHAQDSFVQPDKNLRDKRYRMVQEVDYDSRLAATQQRYQQRLSKEMRRCTRPLTAPAHTGARTQPPAESVMYASEVLVQWLRRNGSSPVLASPACSNWHF